MSELSNELRTKLNALEDRAMALDRVRIDAWKYFLREGVLLISQARCAVLPNRALHGRCPDVTFDDGPRHFALTWGIMHAEVEEGVLEDSRYNRDALQAILVGVVELFMLSTGGEG